VIWKHCGHLFYFLSNPLRRFSSLKDNNLLVRRIWCVCSIQLCTVFLKPLYWSLSVATRMQTTPRNLIYERQILILNCHLNLGLPFCLDPVRFWTKRSFEFLLILIPIFLHIKSFIVPCITIYITYFKILF
jgi:hypothetical protein